jgi:uncharacterized protein (TIGR02246 family)
MTDDEKAIRDMVETWMRASKTGDMATVMRLMADDAVFMVPGHQPFGKEAFKAAAGAQRTFTMNGESEIQEIQVLGDWAYLRNHISVTMTPLEGGKPTRRSGYTLTILHKEPAGNWLLVRDANLMMPDG